MIVVKRMDIIDELFHDEYKPVVVPAHFKADDTWRNKVLFALAEIGEGTAQQTGHKLYELEHELPQAEQQKQAHQILTSLFDKGLIKGHQNKDGEMTYNLSKMTETNTGEETDADQA